MVREVDLYSHVQMNSEGSPSKSGLQIMTESSTPTTNSCLMQSKDCHFLRSENKSAMFVPILPEPIKLLTSVSKFLD